MLQWVRMENTSTVLLSREYKLGISFLSTISDRYKIHRDNISN